MPEALPATVWVFIPLLVAGGAAVIAAMLTQARMAVALARQREFLVEARTLLATQRCLTEERIRAAEETARRKALDEFMADIRVEKRQWMRDSQSLLLQERICLRNIPLTGWMDYEISASSALIAAPNQHAQPGLKLLEAKRSISP